MTGLKAYINSVASYLPKKILTNEDLEKMVDTSDEWIVSRTGIRERRIAGPDECTSDMGYFAAKEALKKANLLPNEVDFILVATQSPDYPFPSTASLIQAKLGAQGAAALDIQAACTGMLYALSIAKAYIVSGAYKNILVITAEKLSSIIDYNDRNTCVLFGDGAAACVISSRGPGLVLGAETLGADGKESHLLVMPAGGSKHPTSEETVKNKMHYLRMDGKELFKHAVRRMESAILETLKKDNLSESDIAYLVPHQANIRIIDALMKRFNVSEDSVVKTIEHYGNTSASSIGIGLDVLLSKDVIRNQDKLLLFAFGAGLTWGAMILTEERES